MKPVAASILYEQIRSSSKLTKLTQIEIARKAKIDQSQVSRILSGQFKRVSAKNLIKLCKFIGITNKRKQRVSTTLEDTIQAVWDGSRREETALVQLLRAADALALARTTAVAKVARQATGITPVKIGRRPRPATKHVLTPEHTQTNKS
jgi:transcriptional regulator with XRE-family HTH domain